jgi:hypothetical protein
VKQEIYNFILRTDGLAILVLMQVCTLRDYYPQFIIDIFSPKVRRIIADCMNPILLILILGLCLGVNVWLR